MGMYWVEGVIFPLQKEKHKEKQASAPEELAEKQPGIEIGPLLLVLSCLSLRF